MPHVGAAGAHVQGVHRQQEVRRARGRHGPGASSTGCVSRSITDADPRARRRRGCRCGNNGPSGEPDATDHFRFNKTTTLTELRKICNHPFLNPVVRDVMDSTDVDLILRASGKFELLDVRCLCPKASRSGRDGVGRGPRPRTWRRWCPAPRGGWPIRVFTPFRHPTPLGRLRAPARRACLPIGLSPAQRILPKLLAVKQQVVLFFQWTTVMDLVEDYFKDRGYKYLRLDGHASGEERTMAMKRFSEPNTEYYLFIATTRAGGQGINLQTAATVIHFESDWNPHADQQAQARYGARGRVARTCCSPCPLALPTKKGRLGPPADTPGRACPCTGVRPTRGRSTHRLGQRQEVRIFRFIVDHSVEEMIVERAQHKLNIDEKVRPRTGLARTKLCR